jgi:hypothetical protein
MPMRQSGFLGMRKGLVLLAAVAAVSGCSIPLPGFLQPGSPAVVGEVRTQTGLLVAPDGTVLMPALSAAELERGIRGSIIRAESIAPTQGFFGAELRPLPQESAEVLVLEFRARPPALPAASGAERTRVLTAAFFLRNRAAAEIRTVRIVSGSNSATLSLR